MIIAASERQAYLLFEKTFDYLYKNYSDYLMKGRYRPTKSRIRLTNSSTIYCLPVGLDGRTIRGYTIHILIADEAAFIPEEVWTAVTPMLAITKGKIILLSTPHGREGYFARCFTDKSFTKFHISSEDCPRKDQDFLDREKARMTKVQYAQEYLGEFIDELRQFFPTALIKDCMSLQGYNTSPISGSTQNFLGVDVARMGEDETALVSLAKLNKDNCKQIDMEITRKTLLPETVARIKRNDLTYKYKKIFVDDGGVGSGVFDPLLMDDQTKRKVVPINNATRSLDNEEKKYKKLLKEDLYNNLLHLMEKKAIQLMESPEVMLSLKSIQYEYTDQGNIKIFGKYDHITEALTRAAWCMRDKSLNIYLY